MKARKRLLAAGLLFSLALLSADVGYGQRRSKTTSHRTKHVLWVNPGKVSTRDLTHGPGAPHLVPNPPFKFLEEDKQGESPKFDVQDSQGVRWTVKLGEEAQAETVATRLVWAVGYFADEAYYLPTARIENLPKLSRGMKYVAENNIVVGARFEPKREHLERGPTWDWADNPFQETRELSGLKVLMILFNNYDATTANNRIVYPKASARREAHYYVSDLGATFGRAGGLGGKRTKNNLHDFLSTRFVIGVEDGAVEFDYDTRPSKLGHLSILYPPYYRGEVKKEKVMRGIPIAHARWIGSLLSQLTDDQLRDAFRAADYSADTIEGYVRTLRERINQLTRL